MTTLPLFAACPKGVETVTAAELAALGAGGIEPATGGVHAVGSLEVLYRAVLWLRTASRLTVELRDFAAVTAQMLYDQTRRIAWERYLPPERTFAVEAVFAGRRPSGELAHSGFAALRIKDAIVDRVRKETGARPSVDTRAPEMLVHAYFAGGRCKLSLDAAGRSLHERGYRQAEATAPLRETLAAALIGLAGWDASEPFLDPMCGSGTLAIEAALMACRMAPGLRLERPALTYWPGFDPGLWKKTVAAARAAARATPAAIQASDVDPKAVAQARRAARAAGVADAIRFDVRPMSAIEAPGPRGTCIVNPPYGERMRGPGDLGDLYEAIGDTFKQRLKGWTAWILAGDRALLKRVGLKAARRLIVFNGPIECRFVRYDMY